MKSSFRDCHFEALKIFSRLRKNTWVASNGRPLSFGRPRKPQHRDRDQHRPSLFGLIVLRGVFAASATTAATIDRNICPEWSTTTTTTAAAAAWSGNPVQVLAGWQVPSAATGATTTSSSPSAAASQAESLQSSPQTPSAASASTRPSPATKLAAESFGRNQRHEPDVHSSDHSRCLVQPEASPSCSTDQKW